MASVANSVCLKHSVSLWFPHQSPAAHRSSSIGFRTFRRSYVVSSSSFSNENREWVIRKFSIFSLKCSHRFLNFLWNSLSLQVCDCWWWQCGWLCGKDFRRTRNGRWTPCDRIQRGSEIKFPILFEIFYLVIVIEVLVGFVNRPMLLMSVQPWQKDICSL